MAEKSDTAQPVPESFGFDKEEFEKAVRNAPQLNRQKLFQEKEINQRMRLMDMAHALYLKSEKYDTFQERFDHLFEEFEELYILAPGMFQAAINRTLYTGEVGKVIKAFQQAQGNPNNIYKNLQDYNNNIVQGAIRSIEDYKRASTVAQSEQSKIDSIIQKHVKSKENPQ